MKLVVGLGNPGAQYTNTRHNAGFQVVDAIAGALRADGTKHGGDFKCEKRMYSDLLKTKLGQIEFVLAKPNTFMNLSGQAVVSILHWFKIELADLLVVHDDVSLPLGKMRFQFGGGAGGQHGVESIIEELGDRRNFNRLKVGVGPDPGGERRAQFVLAQISQEDKLLFGKSIDMSSTGVIYWLKNDLQSTMNKFNGIEIAYTQD